jgi:hypothetical protein
VPAIEAPGTHPPSMHQVLPTRPPRDRLHQQTRVPQMPRNPRPQQLRGRDPEVPTLWRRSGGRRCALTTRDHAAAGGLPRP